MRVFLVFCAIAVGVTNTQEYNYNPPQISQPQRLYNAPSESGNNLNQRYNYEAPSHLYDDPQSHPTVPNQGYNYEAPSHLYDAPQSHPDVPNQGYNYEAPSHLYDAPQSHPDVPNQGYKYEAPSQLYDAPQSLHPVRPNQGYNYEAPSQLYDSPRSLPAQPLQGYDYKPPEESRYVPTLERMPTSEISSQGYNYEAPAPSQLYSPPTASSEPVQVQNPKYLPPQPQTTASPVSPSPAEKYLPPKQEPPYPAQLSTHLEEIKGANEARPYLPKSYNYKPNQPSEISVSKHYFIPQSNNRTTSQGYRYGSPPRTHYRVIFIRSPTPENNQYLEQQQHVEKEKTVIYVLNQEPKGNKYLPPPNPAPTTVQTNPEVFFLNYKTPEEAAQAQQQIQAHYDALGGAAHSLDNSYIPPTPALYPETF